jgi:hypothetical protein
VAVVEVSLIHSPITKRVLAHAELTAVHELSLKTLIIRLIILFALPMLQVLRPCALVHIPVLFVFILALSCSGEVLDVTYIIAPRLENKYPVGGLVLSEVPKEVLLVGEVKEEEALERFCVGLRGGGWKGLLGVQLVVLGDGVIWEEGFYICAEPSTCRA